MKFFSLVLIVSLLSGCASVRPISPDPEGIRESLRPGRTVRIATHGGGEHQFTVTAVTDHEIVGERAVAIVRDSRTWEVVQVNVPLSEIASIEERRVSIGKTAALVMVSARASS